MARIELTVEIKVKVVVEDTAQWAVDYGLEDDSSAAVEADVRDYFGGGGLADEIRNRPGRNTLPYKIVDVTDELTASRIVGVASSL